jgi:hypothetical protein
MAYYEFIWTDRARQGVEIMNDQKVIPMTPELRDHWQRARQETEAELPGLVELGRRMREAGAENTLSGHLRRAIHRSPKELADIAGAAGISPLDLNDFLSGDRTLRSDVLDRLASVVEFSQALARIPTDAKP